MKKVFFASAAITLMASNASAFVPQHLAISSYEGPATCISCHKVEAEDMLNSLHMKWSGPTPELSNGCSAKTAC